MDLSNLEEMYSYYASQALRKIYTPLDDNVDVISIFWLINGRFYGKTFDDI